MKVAFIVKSVLPGNSEFGAGNVILLNPGFQVEAGAVFKAKIQNPCQPTTTSSFGEKIPKELVK